MSCVTTIPIYGWTTSNIPAWDGGARSITSFTGDGYFGFAVPVGVAGVVVGFNTQDSSYHFSDIEHGFHFRRGEFRIIENDMWKDTWRSYAATDRFYVFRVGGDVLYIHSTTGDETQFTNDPRYPGVFLPDNILLVSDKPSHGAVFLDASLFEINDFVYDEDGGEIWIPDPGAGGSIQGNEAAAFGGLSFVGAGAGVATAGTFNGVAYGEVPFSLAATGSIPQGAFNGLIGFRGFAGDNLRGYARGDIRFMGGLANGAAGSDGFQDGIGGKVRGFMAFRCRGAGYPVTANAASGAIGFVGQALGRPATGTDNVLLLMHCDTDSPFVDSSAAGHTITSIGDVQSVAVDATWGGAASFDGAGDALVVGAAGDFNVLHDGSDFELDMRVYFDTSAASQCLFDTGGPQTATRGAFLWSNASSLLQLYVANGSGGYSLLITGSTTVTPDTQHHVRVVSDGGVVTVYLDGAVEASGSPSSPSASNSSFALNFGRRAFDGGLSFGGRWMKSASMGKL
jgi:hypothetical protein